MKRKYSFILAYLIGVASVLLPVWLLISRSAPPPEYGDYTPLLTVAAADVEIRRAELIEYIFGQTQLPQTQPNRNVVTLPNGLTSTIRSAEPSVRNGVAVIYHAGHPGMTESDWKAVNALTAAGFSVYILDMPLSGINPPPTVHVPHLGTVSLTTHEHLAQLTGITQGSPIRYFIEPVIAVSNILESSGYETVYMVGLSGGGWTTTVAAAIDPRIAASYPVAGSTPLGARWTGPDLYTGDWEQFLPELYSIATYEDLYLLGAHGRRQIQILNERDDCCFADPRYPQWEAAVNDALEGTGEFRVLWDTTATKHEISDWAIEAILADMERMH